MFLKKGKRVSIRVSLKVATSKLVDFSYVLTIFGMNHHVDRTEDYCV